MLTCPNVTKEALPLTFQKVRLIKAKAQWGGSQKVPLSCYQRKVLFEQCPECTIKDYHSRRCDTVLCLFDGCPLMGVENEDVDHGIANGTQCIFRSVHLKPGILPQCIQMHGFCVNSVSVEDVEWLELEWQGFEFKRKAGRTMLTFRSI